MLAPAAANANPVLGNFMISEGAHAVVLDGHRSLLTLDLFACARCNRDPSPHVGTCNTAQQTPCFRGPRKTRIGHKGQGRGRKDELCQDAYVQPRACNCAHDQYHITQTCAQAVS